MTNPDPEFSVAEMNAVRWLLSNEAAQLKAGEARQIASARFGEDVMESLQDKLIGSM